MYKYSLKFIGNILKKSRIDREKENSCRHVHSFGHEIELGLAVHLLAKLY